MWRPFVVNFAAHAFENFIKKYARADSAPITSKREHAVKVKKNHSVESILEEAEQRIRDFKNLKKKVIQQRKNIKENDLNIRQKYQFRLQNIEAAQQKEKSRKKQEMMRIRAFSNSKPLRSHKNTNAYKGKKEAYTQESTIFGLTAPVDSGKKATSKTPLPFLGRKYIISPNGLNTVQSKAIPTFSNFSAQKNKKNNRLEPRSQSKSPNLETSFRMKKK